MGTEKKTYRQGRVGHGWTLWLLTWRHKDVRRGQWGTLEHYFEIFYCEWTKSDVQ